MFIILMLFLEQAAGEFFGSCWCLRAPHWWPLV